MEEKITVRLFFMGLIAAVLSIGVSASVYTRSFAVQVRGDLADSARTLAVVWEASGGTADLSAFTSQGLQLARIGPRNETLYNSGDALPDTMYEVEAARRDGSGQQAYSGGWFSGTVYAAAVLLQDGSVLRVARSTGGLGGVLSETYWIMLVLLIVLMLLSVVSALLLTRKLLRPVKALTAQLDGSAEPIREENRVYKELAPFVREIQAQRLQVRYQLQEIEREKNERSAILRHMSEGLLILDARGVILTANESAERYLYDGRPLEGETLLAVTRITALQQAVQQAGEGRRVSCNIEAGGRTLQVLADPVRSGGRRIGVLCLMLDVTERSALDEMKRQFTANVSHELKTPLTSISGYAELLESGMARQPEEVREFAGVIRKEAARLLTLIGDIIKLSELDETGRSLPTESVDLRQLADETAALLRLQAERHGVTLAVEGASLPVTGNRSLLAEVFYNLCDNAIRYNRPGGHVWVTVADGAFTVRDDGIGIPQEHQARVFERFYRVDKSRSKQTGGTGLGLAIVKHVAALHGAQIELHSSPGQGVSIRFSMPV